MRICVVKFERRKKDILLAKLSQIILRFDKDFRIITHNWVGSFSELMRNPLVEGRHSATKGKGDSIRSYVRAQWSVSERVLQLSNRVDVLFFFTGGSVLLLPVLCARMKKLKTCVLVTGSPSESYRAIHGISLRSRLFSLILTLSEMITLAFSDIILMESLQSRHWLKDLFRRKARFGFALPVETDKFYPDVPITERENLIGYVGRISREKGILEFIESFPLLKKNADLKVVVVGDGPARKKIETRLARMSSIPSVQLTGHVDHARVPAILNRIKVLVIPSATEGLPNIMLEAMSCGCIVLATPVGDVPSVLRDGTNGFLIADSSPLSIATTLCRVLQCPNLAEISQSASTYVRRYHSVARTMDRYGELFKELGVQNP